MGSIFYVKKHAHHLTLLLLMDVIGKIPKLGLKSFAMGPTPPKSSFLTLNCNICNFSQILVKKNFFKKKKKIK